MNLNALWEYANPLKFIRTTERVLPAFAVAAFACLVGGLVWGFFFTPDDYRQGATVKIFYIHVPSAMMAINIWAMMLVTSLVWLVRRHHVSALAARAAAPVGAVMTVIALVTGAIWGKPTWGTWWVWDARITSMLILLFLYLGVVALYEAYDNKEAAGKACAVLTLVGTVNIPIIYKSVDWWYSLHQPASIKFTGDSTIDPSMLYPLLLMIAAFYGVFTCCLLMNMRAEILEREARTNWVKKLALEYRA